MKGKYLGNNAQKFPLESILEFLEKQGVNDDNLRYIGSCNDECAICGSDDWEIYRESFAGWDNETSEFFLNEENEYENEVDFSIYRCRNCGAWLDYIE